MFNEIDVKCVDQETKVWFDREGEKIDNKECRQSVKDAYKVVESLIAEEGRNGVPPERIVIGR